MSFDISVSDQSVKLEHNIKGSFYKKLYELSQSRSWIRLTGIGVGIVSGLLTIAKRISLIAENIIKALVNILGAPFFDKCHFGRGLEQGFRAVFHTCALPFAMASAAVGMVSKPFFVFINTTPYLYDKWADHDIAEWNSRAMRIQRQQERDQAYLQQIEAEGARARAAEVARAERDRREALLAQTRPLAIRALDSHLGNLESIQEGLVSLEEGARTALQNDSTDLMEQINRDVALNTLGARVGAYRAAYDATLSTYASLGQMGASMGVAMSPQDHRGHPDYDQREAAVVAQRSRIEDLLRELESLAAAQQAADPASA